MLLDKPLSVGHFGERGELSVIYSVDVHPDGSRFATGGGDYKVKIWSMSAFSKPVSARVTTVDTPDYSPKDEDLSVLAVLSQHTGSVQCVRWSPDGRYLASGSDDNFLLVWELRQGAASSAPFGSHDAPNKENWTRVWTLRGHTMDVLDCAWSPRGSLLASCSIDNNVMVWKVPAPGDVGQGSGWGESRGAVGTMLNPFRILKGHTSWVKGVAWDPIGRYLSSIGEDNKLLVWRVGEWEVEVTLSDPFAKCEETLVRMLNWSPDGQYLSAPNSKNAGLHVAVIFKRGKWFMKPTHLVGYSQPTLAAVFSPTIYRKLAPAPPASISTPKQQMPADLKGGSGGGESASDSGNNTCESGASGNGSGATKDKVGGNKAHAKGGRSVGLYPVLAVAGQEGIVTLWIPGADRPVAILKGLFDKPPSDLSWGADGYTLVVSGHDGTVVVLRLTPQELGVPVSEEERLQLLGRLYGADAAEGLDLVGLTLAGSSPSIVENPHQLALERSREGGQLPGRRAISSGSSNRVGGDRVGVKRPHTTAPMTGRSEMHQVESRSKGGKKRIRPILLIPEGGPGAQGEKLDTAHDGPWANNGGASTGGTSPMSTLSKRPRVAEGTKRHRHSHSQYPPPAPAAVVRVGSSLDTPLMSPPSLMPRKPPMGGLVRQICGDGEGAFRPPARRRENGDGGAEVCVGQREGLGQGQGLTGRGGGEEGVGMAGLGLENERGGRIGKSGVLECSPLPQEFRSLPARRYTRVTMFRGGKVVWSNFLAGIATSCCGNSRVGAVGVEDGSIYIYDRSGTLVAPALVISPPVAYLECSGDVQDPTTSISSKYPQNRRGVVGDQLMAISGEGEVFVWDLDAMSLTVKGSLGPLMRSLSLGSSLASQSPTSTTAGKGRDQGETAGGQARASGGDAVHTGGGAGGSAATTGGSGGGVSVVRAGVTSEGSPLVLMSCPGGVGGGLQVFLLHKGLGTWVRVADGRYSLSNFYGSGPCTVHATGLVSGLQGIVRSSARPSPSALLQASALPATHLSSSAMRGITGEGGLQVSVTRTHLEDSMACALMLGSSEEFVDILQAYAGCLAKTCVGANDARVRALCDKLLVGCRPEGDQSVLAVTVGGSEGGANGGALELGARFGSGPTVLGVSKFKLLKEVVLPALGANRSLQRLVHEYSNELSLINPPHCLSQSSAPLEVRSKSVPGNAVNGVTNGVGGGAVEEVRRIANANGGLSQNAADTVLGGKGVSEEVAVNEDVSQGDSTSSGLKSAGTTQDETVRSG